MRGCAGVCEVDDNRAQLQSRRSAEMLVCTLHSLNCSTGASSDLETRPRETEKAEVIGKHWMLRNTSDHTYNMDITTIENLFLI